MEEHMVDEDLQEFVKKVIAWASTPGARQTLSDAIDKGLEELRVPIEDWRVLDDAMRRPFTI